MQFVFSDEVLVQKNGKLFPEKVTNVSSLTIQGMYVWFSVDVICTVFTYIKSKQLENNLLL